MQHPVPTEGLVNSWGGCLDDDCMVGSSDMRWLCYICPDFKCFARMGVAGMRSTRSVDRVQRLSLRSVHSLVSLFKVVLPRSCYLTHIG